MNKAANKLEVLQIAWNYMRGTQRFKERLQGLAAQ